MYDTLLSLPLFQGMSQTDFNSLLAALRTAGILSATAPETTETPAEGEGGGG